LGRYSPITMFMQRVLWITKDWRKKQQIKIMSIGIYVVGIDKVIGDKKFSKQEFGLTEDLKKHIIVLQRNTIK
jgi:hypothetical protein